MIEEQARKQIKEQETRKQAAQLINHLLFADVSDFEDGPNTKSFRQVDFIPEAESQSQSESEEGDDEDQVMGEGENEAKTCAIESKRDTTASMTQPVGEGGEYVYGCAETGSADTLVQRKSFYPPSKENLKLDENPSKEILLSEREENVPTEN